MGIFLSSWDFMFSCLFLSLFVDLGSSPFSDPG